MLKWNISALGLNAPDNFLVGFPEKFTEILSYTSPSLWTQLFVPRRNYPDISAGINIIIERISDTNQRDLFKLLNRIRFGPEDHLIEIEVNTSMKDLLIFCHCASLANKMDLFTRLLPKVMPFIRTDPSKLDEWYYDIHHLEAFKFAIDIHEFSGLAFRQVIYAKTDIINILSKYCTVSFVEAVENELTIKFKTPAESHTFGIPDHLVINRQFETESSLIIYAHEMPDKMKFDNPEVFKAFLPIFYKEFPNYDFNINGHNLKLIAQSESLQNYLRQNLTLSNNRAPFRVQLRNLLSVVHEPVVNLADIVRLYPHSLNCLHDFSSAEQLERLETLTGCTVAKLIKPDCNYFKYRNVFKYAIGKGQKLPTGLHEQIKTLLQIDFPDLQ